MVGDAAPLRFSEGFLWGAATAAHQVEGGNWNNDWWAWEQDPQAGCREPGAHRLGACARSRQLQAVPGRP